MKRWHYILLCLIVASIGASLLLPAVDKRFNIFNMNSSQKQTVALGTYGDIANALIDTWEYNQTEAHMMNPYGFLRLGTSNYFISAANGASGSDNDGWLRTFEIGDDGIIIENIIDKWEYDASDGRYAGLCHISGDVYAVIYYDLSPAGIIKIITTTVYSTNGTLKKDTIDTQNLAYAGYVPTLIHVTGNVYVASYQQYGGGYDHYIETFEISTAGVITNTHLDIQLVDATCTNILGHIHEVMIDTDTVAVVWTETITNDGWLVTYNISAVGVITNTSSDTWEFDVSNPRYDYIYEIIDNIFAISYIDSSSDGWTKTVIINDAGVITPGAAHAWIDSLEWGDADTISYISMFTVANASSYDPGVYGVTYKDSESDGQILTMNISNDGTIGAAIVDEWEFDLADNIMFAPVVNVYQNFYAICYESTSNDGWVSIVNITTNYVPVEPGASWHTVNTWNGSLYVSTTWHATEWNGSLYTSSSFLSVAEWNGSLYVSPSFNAVNTWNGSLYVQSAFNLQTEWNGSLYAEASYNIANDWNGSLYYVPIVTNITLTNEVPVNASKVTISIDKSNISGHTGDITISIQRNSTEGLNMNTSIYFNGTLIYTNLSYGNGTLSFWLFDYYFGSVISGHTYTWAVNCSNGTQYINSSYLFTPRTISGVSMAVRDNSIIYLVVGLFFGLIVPIRILRSRRGKRA